MEMVVLETLMSISGSFLNVEPVDVDELDLDVVVLRADSKGFGLSSC